MWFKHMNKKLDECFFYIIIHQYYLTVTYDVTSWALPCDHALVSSPLHFLLLGQKENIITDGGNIWCSLNYWAIFFVYDKRNHYLQSWKIKTVFSYVKQHHLQTAVALCVLTRIVYVMFAVCLSQLTLFASGPQALNKWCCECNAPLVGSLPVLLPVLWADRAAGVLS